MSGILATKLYIPSTRPGLVLRSRLIRLLQDAPVAEPGPAVLYLKKAGGS